MIRKSKAWSTRNCPPVGDARGKAEVFRIFKAVTPAKERVIWPGAKGDELVGMKRECQV
jgi:hypothetical protein